MCSLRFENNLLTIEGVLFTLIWKKTPLSKLSFAFVSLALPFLEGRLLYRGGDLSMEGETHLRRGRLVYGGGDSSMEGEAHLRRGRLVYRGGDSSTEGETRL
jgi:hypothetical protein